MCAINKNDIKQKKIMIKYIFSSVNMKIYFTSLKYMNIKLHINYYVQYKISLNIRRCIVQFIRSTSYLFCAHRGADLFRPSNCLSI